MASRIVTVCLFCLLCAAHSMCFAHASASPDTEATDRKLNVLSEASLSPPFSTARRKQGIEISDNVRTKRHSDKQPSQLVDTIDTEFYIKKLFTQFGDRETMTMNLTGFEMMLKKLDLDRMVTETKGNNGKNSLQNQPVEFMTNGVRNSTNVTCVNSLELVLSMHGTSPKHHHHDTENTPLDELKGMTIVNSKTISKVCPILLYQKVAQTSYERQGCIVERGFPRVRRDRNISTDAQTDEDGDDKMTEDRTMVWVYSSLSIFAISACGIFGVVVIPIMQHAYYQQILQFLVALAVGTLSGDALLHLLPHAMAPHADHDHHHSHHHEHSESAHHDNMMKGLVAIIGVVFFYFTEKVLTLITEYRKKRMRQDKENKLPSRVRVMRNDNIGCLKGSGSCSSKTGSTGFLKLPAGMTLFKSLSRKQNVEANSAPNTSKVCKHKYSEYPYCYDEIATDTHDDHHVRTDSVKANGKNEEAGLSVVSSNNFNDHSAEPGVNDSLLSEDGRGNKNKLDTMSKKAFEVIDNISAKRIGVTSVDGYTRSRSADRATEMQDIETSKPQHNQEESYTVIIREHSQTHHGHSHSHGHVHSPPSSLSSVVWMVIMGDGLHNFTDGMAIGAAFSSNIAGGFSTAIAVLCHELPHEIGDFAVLLKAGMSAKRAIFYNVLSSVLCLLGMIVGVAAGDTPEATSWIFAAAAGMFMYIALVDMIPELSSSHSTEGSFCQCLLQLAGLSCGIGIMYLIAVYEHELMRLFG